MLLPSALAVQTALSLNVTHWAGIIIGFLGIILSILRSTHLSPIKMFNPSLGYIELYFLYTIIVASAILALIRFINLYPSKDYMRHFPQIISNKFGCSRVAMDFCHRSANLSVPTYHAPLDVTRNAIMNWVVKQYSTSVYTYEPDYIYIVSLSAFFGLTDNIAIRVTSPSPDTTTVEVQAERTVMPIDFGFNESKIKSIYQFLDQSLKKSS